MISETPTDWRLKSLWIFACAVAFGAWVLVLAGGQVTSTDSGDSVPTWPLPIFIPLPAQGGEFFELGHRQVAALVGILNLALWGAAACIRRRLESWHLRLAAATAGLMLIQAALGGVRVLVGAQVGTAASPLVATTGVLHTLLGQTYFAALGILACFLSPGFRSRPAQASGGGPRIGGASRLPRAATLAILLLFLQIFLGAVLRLTRPGPVPELVLAHILGALVVTVALANLAVKFYREWPAFAFLKKPIKLCTFVLLAQLVLGFAAYFAVKGDGSPAAPEWSWKTVIPSIHVGLGALLLFLAGLIRSALWRLQAADTGVPEPALQASEA
jgi:heme A synthase